MSVNNPVNGRLMKAATYASFTTAVLLLGLKAWAWAATDSVAVLSSLIDSLLDGFASLITMLAVHHALVPADDEHRFGHGKAEPLAAMAQSAFIAASALILTLQAVNRFLAPQPIERDGLGIAIMGISIIATLVLVAFQSYVLRRTGSIAIRADRLHYLGDLLPNIAVIAALLLISQLGWLWLDPLFGLAAAVYLLRGAWRTGRDSLDMLMDHELPDETRYQITELALSEKGVLGMHDLRTRRSGSTVFIQLHLELPPDMALADAHAIALRVENRILHAFPDSEIIIHEDPFGLPED